MVSRYNSLAMVEGSRTIGQINGSDYELLYIGADNAAGTSGGARQTVVGDDDVAEYSSMAMIDGRAAIAYADTVNSELGSIRADNSQRQHRGHPGGG